MPAFSGEPSELFVALRDRPFVPSPSTVPDAEIRHSLVKPLHMRKVTRERVRTVRSRRIRVFRLRDCCVAATLIFRVWPDMTQTQPALTQSRPVQADWAYRMSMASTPATPFRLDPATTYPD